MDIEEVLPKSQQAANKIDCVILLFLLKKKLGK